MEEEQIWYPLVIEHCRRKIMVHNSCNLDHYLKEEQVWHPLVVGVEDGCVVVWLDGSHPRMWLWI